MYLYLVRKLVMYVCIRMDDLSFSCCRADVAVLGLLLGFATAMGANDHGGSSDSVSHDVDLHHTPLLCLWGEICRNRRPGWCN